jgi:hypothetical protein
MEGDQVQSLQVHPNILEGQVDVNATGNMHQETFAA